MRMEMSLLVLIFGNAPSIEGWQWPPSDCHQLLIAQRIFLFWHWFILMLLLLTYENGSLQIIINYWSQKGYFNSDVAGFFISIGYLLCEFNLLKQTVWIYHEEYNLASQKWSECNSLVPAISKYPIRSWICNTFWTQPFNPTGNVHQNLFTFRISPACLFFSFLYDRTPVYLLGGLLLPKPCLLLNIKKIF